MNYELRITNQKSKQQNRCPHNSLFIIRNSNLGFSLIELIIYVAIFSVISAVFVAVLIQLSFGESRSKVTTEVQQNLRSAMEAVAKSARDASRVTAPSPGNSGNVLTLIAKDGQTVQYATTSVGVLQKQVGANPPENITTDKVKVTALNFTTLQNTAQSNSAVTATSTRFAITVEYDSTQAQFLYSQSATSTERIGG